MGRLEEIDDMTQSERAQFQRICRKLLKMTFIVREKNEDHRRDYNFIKNNSKIFSEFFNIIGYDVVCDTDSAVARLVNLAAAGEEGSIQSNRKSLKLWESIVLSALWLIYSDRIVNGSLTRAVIIQKAELDFQLEKLGGKNRLDKGKMISVLEMLEDYNLIEIIGEVGDPDCKIKLYTSMQFCLSETEFKKLATTTAQKMMNGNKGNNEDVGSTINEEGEIDE